jgi:tetratricopeptide (TPR) repeat protein
MIESRYCIVFKGEVKPGENVEAVKENLSNLFKVKKGKIDRFFSGRVIVIKKDVDLKTAKKFESAFLQAGAICHIRKIPSHIEKKNKNSVSIDHGNNLETVNGNSLFGLPVDTASLFIDHNDAYQEKLEKKQKNLLRSIAHLKSFLKKNEKILYITAGCSPFSIIEKFILVFVSVYIKRCLLIFTNERILHIPTKINRSPRNMISQILYSDCQSVVMKRGSLRVIYKSGQKEFFRSILIDDRKKINHLVRTISFRGEISSRSKRKYLCPRCGHRLVRKKVFCMQCRLVFKRKSKALLYSFWYPGGGYFYTHHPIAGIVDIFMDMIILAIIISTFINGNPSNIPLFAGLFIFKKLISIYHSSVLIDEFIPEKKKIRNRIPSRVRWKLYHILPFGDPTFWKRLVVSVSGFGLFILLCQPLWMIPGMKRQMAEHKKYEKVYQAIEEKNYSQARDECQKLIESNPKDPLPLVKTAEILQFHGRYSEAILYYEKAKEIEPNEVRYVIDCAGAYERYKNLEAALKDLTAGLELSKKLDNKSSRLSKLMVGPVYWHQRNVLLKRGMINQELGAYKDAVKDLLSIISLLKKEAEGGVDALIRRKVERDMQKSGQTHPIVDLNAEEKSRVYVNLAQVYVSIGDTVKAIESYSNAIKAAYNNGDAYFERGKYFKTLGKENNARKDFEDALWYYTEDVNETFNRSYEGAIEYIKRGDLYIEMGKPELAMADYISATRCELTYLNQSQMENIYDAYCRIGKMELEQGKFTEALNHFIKASELCSFCPKSYLYQGQVYMEEGKRTEAILCFSKAIEQSYFYPEAFYERGAARIGTHEHDEGIRDIEFILSNVRPALAIYKKAEQLLSFSK